MPRYIEGRKVEVAVVLDCDFDKGGELKKICDLLQDLSSELALACVSRPEDQQDGATPCWVLEALDEGLRLTATF